MTVPPAVVPNPVALVTTSLPEFTLVVPLYVLAPLNVSVPAPFLFTEPVPEITPAKLAVPVELEPYNLPVRAIASAPTSA